jgi:hypothetical protein
MLAINAKICIIQAPFFKGENTMYLALSKKPRKTKRNKTARMRAKLKRKQLRRVRRMVT